MSFAPIYFTIADIKNFLYGKVEFGTDPIYTMPDFFLSDLCAMAEAEALVDLNPFYVMPLQSKTTHTYVGLPSNTQAFLFKIFASKVCEFILQEDFGQESSAISNNYLENMAKSYYVIMRKLYRRDPLTGRYMTFPLQDLMINQLYYTGLTAVPTPKVTHGPRGILNNMKYAINQTTQPARSWWDFGAGQGPNGPREGNL